MINRLSKTGTIFAWLFVTFRAWCINSFFKGEWQAMDIIAYITLPFSLAIHYICSSFQPLLDFSYVALNWLEVTLDIFCGALEFYFFGWLL